MKLEIYGTGFVMTKVYLIEPDDFRRSIYRRHLQLQGINVVEESLCSDGEGNGERATWRSIVIANLSGEGRRPVHKLAELHNRFSGSPFILLLDMEQTVTAEEALAFGVHALLRYPVRFEELNLHISRCSESNGQAEAARVFTCEGNSSPANLSYIPAFQERLGVET